MERRESEQWTKIERKMSELLKEFREASEVRRAEAAPSPKSRATRAPMSSHYLRETDAAEYLGMKVGTLRMRRRQGAVRFFRPPPGKVILHRKQDLDAWVESGQHDPVVIPLLGVRRER